jgi:thiol-disulfide isomerase/thioredoxin
MKKLIILLLLTCSAYSQNISNYKIEDILRNIRAESNKLLQAEYNIQRIDTFTTGKVWNHNGYALIERSKKDSLFGLYFIGERFDINEQSIYDGRNEFWINKINKTYQIHKPGKGFLGSPGGQMVCNELFFPDSIYKSVDIIKENKSSYIIKYNFDDITDYNITNRIKICEIDKNSFLPIAVSYSYRMLDKKGVHQYLLSNIKVNDLVQHSIDNMKTELSEYKYETEARMDTSKTLVNKEAPIFKLPELFNTAKYYELVKGKFILLDFWEVWCGPCIKSFPEVEKIYKKFSNDLEVIGITTSEIESAKKMVKLKELTYKNLLGSENIFKEYAVVGVPRYVLIDKKGIIRNEYLGFDPQIENDISKLIKE